LTRNTKKFRNFNVLRPVQNLITFFRTSACATIGKEQASLIFIYPSLRNRKQSNLQKGQSGGSAWPLFHFVYVSHDKWIFDEQHQLDVIPTKFPKTIKGGKEKTAGRYLLEGLDPGFQARS